MSLHEARGLLTAKRSYYDYHPVPDTTDEERYKATNRQVFLGYGTVQVNNRGTAPSG
jgi:hypothetical protein